MSRKDGWGQEVVLEVTIPIHGHRGQYRVHVATAWQNNGVSGNPEASDIQNAAADLTGVCVFTARA